MKAWMPITVTNRQALSLGTGSTRAYFTRTQPVIPGAAIRGALATQWRVQRSVTSPDFRKLFDGGIRFGPLLKEDAVLESQSVLRCKYHKAQPSQPHEEYHDEAFTPASKSNCGRGWVPLKGEMLGLNLEAVTNTAINHETQVALAASLFSREAHAAHTRFVGHLVGDRDVLEQLRSTTPRRIVLGGRKSVIGSAEVEFGPLQPDPPGMPTRSGTPDALQRIVIRTISPTVLIDDDGNPTTDLATVLSTHGLTLVRSSSVWAGRTTDVGTSGWHAASNTPKPEELALAAGAVAVLTDVDPSALRAILDRGLGVRTTEGMGFLEIVRHPWQPPGKDGHSDTESVDVQQADALRGLMPEQRAWVAKQLRDEHADTNTMFGQGRGRNIPDDLKGIIRAAMARTQRERNLVASHLREEQR